VPSKRQQPVPPASRTAYRRAAVASSRSKFISFFRRSGIQDHVIARDDDEQVHGSRAPVRTRLELQKLGELLDRKLRIPQDLLEQPSANHPVVRNSNRWLSGTHKANMTAAPARFAATSFRERLHDCLAGKNR